MKRTDFQVVDYIDSVPEKTIVIVGTAENGPSNTPFIMTSENSVYDLLGQTPLAKAYVQTVQAGITNVVLYRINGKHSTATLSYRDENDVLTDILKFKSVSANDLYNSITDDGTVNKIKVSIDGTALIVTNSDGTRRTYLLRQYTTASSLADALNIDAAYGLVEFDTEALIPSFELFRFTEESAFEATFSGADTELDLIIDRKSTDDHTEVVTELKSRLIAALYGDDPDDQAAGSINSWLGLLDYGGITLADLYHEDDPEIAMVLGTFCQNKSMVSGQGCIAVVGTTPVYEPTEAKLLDKANKLYGLSPIAKYMSPGGLSDGSTVTVVGGAVIPLNYVMVVTGDTPMRTNIITNPEPFTLAPAYLATVIALPYYNNPTNKRISGISTVGYEFSKEVIDNLAANGYISIVSSIRKGFVAYQAVTAVGSNSKSALKKPHYVRISQQIGRLLNDSLDDVIGSTRGRNSLSLIDQRIRQIMQNLVDSQAIRGYVVACEFQKYNTELKVTVGFTPYTDVEMVTSVTTLPLGQGV